jgi:hypothetical protein
MSYYTRIGEHSYRPTEHAGGAWNPTEIHFSPLGGLLLHEIDLHHGDRGLSLGRVSFDILGFLGTADCEIRVETIRPGRTIELVEAVATELEPGSSPSSTRARWRAGRRHHCPRPRPWPFRR